MKFMRATALGILALFGPLDWLFGSLFSDEVNIAERADVFTAALVAYFLLITWRPPVPADTPTPIEDEPIDTGPSEDHY